MSVVDQIEETRVEFNRRLDEIAEAAAEAPSINGGPAVGPEVIAAAQKLAEQVARAQGADLPLAAAPGQAPAILELPEEFQKYGGVGVAVIVAPPTEAARSAPGP